VIGYWSVNSQYYGIFRSDFIILFPSFKKMPSVCVCVRMSLYMCPAYQLLEA
jgi:hypothetical protein